MVMVGLPAPQTFAPMALRKLPRSITSGSQAALLYDGYALRQHGGSIMTLAVPSTVGPERPPKNNSVPLSLAWSWR